MIVVKVREYDAFYFQFSLFYYIGELFCLIAGVYNVALKRFAVVSMFFS